MLTAGIVLLIILLVAVIGTVVVCNPEASLFVYVVIMIICLVLGFLKRYGGAH